jgi:2-polyprenyl-3-methyl-5-hydroxy-6-metoxy-1,4-benzoquinol methylase
MAKHLIVEGPEIGDRPVRLLESSNLKDIEGSWEQPLLDYYERESIGKKKNALDALQHIHALNGNKGQLLDFGCFNGFFLSIAAQEGWECQGIEPLVMPAIYARGKFGLNVTTGTLADGTFPPETFDLVTAFQVFEHLVNPDQELEKIRRIIKPNGMLMIEVPNIETLSVKIFRSRHRHFVQDHVSFFSARTLSCLVQKCGFRVINVYYPVRFMSIQHLILWIEKLSPTFGNRLARMMPKSLYNQVIRISFRDIVTVIAQKDYITHE